MLELLIASTCIMGNINACGTAASSYVQYKKLDEVFKVIENNIKINQPMLYGSLVLAHIGTNKQYKVLLYNNIWYSVDISSSNNTFSELLYYKSF